MKRHQGRVFKRATKAGDVWRFQADAIDPATGKRRQVTRSGFSTRGEAQAALRAYLNDRDQGVERVGRSPQLGPWLAEVWLPTLAGKVKPSTEALYRQIVRANVVPRIGGVRLADLDAAALERLYRQLADDGLAPKSIKNVHAVVRRALRDAVRWRVITTNPAAMAEAPRVPRSTPQTWTGDEVRRFLAAVEGDRLVALWRLLAATGMRRGEALGLRWQDVDLDAGEIRVVQQLSEYAGAMRFSTPKTASGARRVALDGATVTALREHRRRQLEERLAWGAGYQDGGLVFAREDGTPLRPATVTRALADLAVAAGVPRLTPHGLRHTWATLALASGVHPKVVADRLGHASVAVTLDRYSHVVEGLDRAAADTVAAVIDGPAR